MTTTLTSHRAAGARSPDPARLSALVAAGASLAYAIAGGYWMAGGLGFPFGVENDPLARYQSILESLTQRLGAPWVVALGVLGALVGLLLAQLRRLTILAWILIVAAGVQGVAYALIIPDGRVLIAVAHVPILVAGKPFGWPPGVTIASQVSWPVAHQLLLMALGVLWGVVAVTARRRLSGACSRCGRGAEATRWINPARALVWGRWAVGVAVVVPAVYALTRLAWALGLPLGVSREFLVVQQQESPTIFLAGAFMAMLALIGGVLTLGLVQRWGEVYPRWVLGLAGRPVRPRTAIIPATAAAVLITGAGIGWFRTAIAGYFPDGALGRDWATVAPGALWPLWGVALAVATYAYYLRRRGRCRSCGRSDRPRD